MIKKIKSSLLVKVFLITSIMLLFVSLLMFGLLAWLMPQTYSNKLNTILDERTQEFIAELEQVPFSNSGGLFDQFIQDMEINSVELYNSNNDLLPLPTVLFNGEEWGMNIAQSSDDFMRGWWRYRSRAVESPTAFIRNPMKWFQTPTSRNPAAVHRRAENCTLQVRKSILLEYGNRTVYRNTEIKTIYLYRFHSNPIRDIFGGKTRRNE